ncbi:hypothetical protein QWA_07079 [Alcaligenes faecalis subsp. faecalis NCIB 8687]|nr:hypothetical protein QWA_07079 [Alcaligenes faecalis subsp. faecalis NCIB 8687]
MVSVLAVGISSALVPAAIAVVTIVAMAMAMAISVVSASIVALTRPPKLSARDGLGFGRGLGLGDGPCSDLGLNLDPAPGRGLRSLPSWQVFPVLTSAPAGVLALSLTNTVAIVFMPQKHP